MTFTFVVQNAIFLINMIDVMNITCSIPGIRKDEDWESHTINWKRVSIPCLSKMTVTIMMIWIWWWGEVSNPCLSKLMIAMTIIIPTRHCRGSQSICGVWGRRMVGWLVLSSSPDRLQNPHKGRKNVMYTLFVHALLCVIVEAEDADVKSSKQGLEWRASLWGGGFKSAKECMWLSLSFPAHPYISILETRMRDNAPAEGKSSVN